MDEESEDNATAFNDCTIGAEFKMYTWPLLLVVGTLGNVVSLIVLRRLSRDVLSTCLYLAVQCAADLFVLYTRCGIAWVVVVNGCRSDINGNLMARSEMICKSLPFLCGSIYHLSRWLATAAAIEGVIACRYPHT
jgi:hypothetical protein